MSIDDVNTETRFMVLFTSGSLLTWGKPLDASSGVSPRYLSTIYSQLIISPFLLQTSYNERVPFLFTRGRQVEEGDGLNVGDINICPPLQWFHIPSLTPVKLSSLTSLKALGEKQRVCHDITFLLVLAKEEATGDRKNGLLTIWVNPGQARAHSLKEVVGNRPGSPVDPIGPMPWCNYT